MTLHEVSGDILLTKAHAIAHGVAPNDHFDSGLALALRERWPVMAKDFRHYAHQEHPDPGEVWFWGGAGGVRIFNLMTQEGRHEHGARPGKATVPNVRHALQELAKQVKSEGIESLALPRLATGVGGLDWDDVRPLVQEHLGGLGIPVYVYTTFHRGEAASEPEVGAAR
ncbi:MAG: macro domain-containing protein [Planctomycetota bacterium]